jgi:hypothetical protein
VSLDRISAEEALGSLASFSDVIDARSEGEYAEDHLPGAVNWPSLHDEERKDRRHQSTSRSASSRPKNWAPRWWPKTSPNIFSAGRAGQTPGVAAADLLLARRQAQRRAGAGAGPDRLQDHAGGWRL